MVGPSATCVRAQNADNLAKGGVGGWDLGNKQLSS